MRGKEKVKAKDGYNNMRNFIFLFFLLFLVSCSPLEMAGLLGIGTKFFKEQGKVYTENVNKDLASCYEQTLNVLAKMKARVYRGSLKQRFIVAKQFRASFKWSTDSTEVAIFFTELAPDKTKVEVASLNYSLAEFVASKLFETLNSSLN